VPNANYNWPDSFTFVARDGALTSNVATVSLTISAVNDAPVAQAAAYSTLRNNAFTGNLVASDVDGNSLTYVITTQPTKGIVIVNSSTGGFTYIPGAGKTGADSFRFRVSDGTTNSNIARIDVTIR
jgi:large repetitive protein